MKKVTGKVCYCGKPCLKGYAHCKRCIVRYSDYHASDIAKQKRNDRRAQCKLDGICTHCQKEKADEGFARCSSCREKFRIHSQKARDRNGGTRLLDRQRTAEKVDLRREKGLCYRCGRDPVPGKKKCQSCLNKNKIQMQRWRARKKAERILEHLDELERYRL